MLLYLRLIRLAFLVGLLTSLLVLTAAAHAQHPADDWEFSVLSGYLKKVKSNSPFDYRIVPTQAVWRSPTVFNLWHGAGGERLTVRNRFTAVLETVTRGLEDYYLAFTAAPTVELVGG